MISNAQRVAEGLEQWGKMEMGWQVGEVRQSSHLMPNITYGHLPSPKCGVSPSKNTNWEWETITDSGNAADMNMQDLPSFYHPATQIQSHINPDNSSNLGQHQPIASGTFDDMQDHQRTVLIWPRAGTNIQVIATDLVHFPSSWTWPTSMRLEIWEVGLGTLDIQSRIFKGKAPMARIECAPGMGGPKFEELVGSLRRVGGFAVAQHGIHDEGRHLRHLFAPFGSHLLCAVLPDFDIQELRKSRRQSRKVPLAVAEDRHGQSSQEITFAAKDVISPPHQLHLQQQAHNYQFPPQHPQAPWAQQPAPLDIAGNDGELDDRGMDAGTAPDSGLGDAHVIGLISATGSMDRVGGICNAPS
ncbi:hypothetical protein F5148DRAFT_523349 [Russula earlei]|uniref:Uncharacterized protein n=1 Tax=Russula earlei TaxID=71964 RepID=A0ACC0UGL7_9AGAM|nr:hypothetical protein F5148DRAFT_523349 [Russula earlei]